MCVFLLNTIHIKDNIYSIFKTVDAECKPPNRIHKTREPNLHRHASVTGGRLFRLFRHTNSDCDLPQYFRCYASGVVQRCVLVYGVTAAAVAVAAAARSCYVYFNSYKRKRNTQNCNEIKKSSFKSTHTQTQNNTIKYTIYFSAVNAARSVLAPHRRRQCTMHSIQYTQSGTKIKRKQREKKTKLCALRLRACELLLLAVERREYGSRTAS